MKIIITVLLVIIGLSDLHAQDPLEKRIKEVRAKQLELRNSKDSSDWYNEKMTLDLTSDSEKIIMTNGVYNYPKYSLLNQFTGTGTGGRARMAMPIQLKDKQVVYDAFNMRKNELYPSIKADREIFFAIITVADVNASNYKATSEINSRNHPDYLGQGFIRSGDAQIDYITFTTIDKGNFAIVNKRIFDLSHGSIVLIAPQKDGTLRSMQLQINVDAKIWPENPKSADDLPFDVFLRKDLLKREDIMDFFTNSNVK